MKPMRPPTPCNGTSRTRAGAPCGNPAMIGGTVCRMHGGAAPQVRKAARQRILDAADDAASVLVTLMTDTLTPHAVRLAAARDLLDRAGEGAKQQVEVTTHDGDLADLDAALDRLSAARSPSGLADDRTP